ncbi:hypothetical protein [Haloplanus pelagicus]|jgi:hypothetical protein|nr:hypothetical protein [Haloplanus sp. HW8-1]
MSKVPETGSGQQSSEDAPYLPGMPRLSNTSGPVERFLTRLFRRRGRF